jgi:hypothetical protein
MLSGEFIETRLGEIPFADDDPQALLLVLRIAHLRFHEIPQQISDEKFVEVATICDKYDTVAICRPFIRDWMEAWLKRDILREQKNVKFLWIAWVFGYEEQFIEIAKALQKVIYIDDAGNCMSDDVKDNILDDNMPPDLLGKFSSFNAAVKLPRRISDSVLCFHDHFGLSHYDMS